MRLPHMLDRLRRREPEAYQEALARYGGPLYAALRRIVPTEAEDIAQETFARLFQNIHRVRRLRSWLYAVAMNLARTHLRRIAPVPPPRIEPLSDFRESIDAAIATLPEKAKVAFLLREVSGLTTEEIAEAEGCSEDAVRQRLTLARRKLREHLGPLLERSPI